jgi:hypothetical protein
MRMTRRRFVLLATVLVALNLVLWLAPAGLALRSALLSSLFGPRMIRAEVIVQSPLGGAPQDFRVDRGLVTASTATSFTLREQDGTTATIPTSVSTRVSGPLRFTALPLHRGLRVLVIRQANEPAQVVQVEGRG